jgi:hypothetical protein
MIYCGAVAVAALIVAIASALAALGAVWFARRLDRTAKEAREALRRSMLASEKRTELESDRRKHELTPRFRVTMDWSPLVKGDWPSRIKKASELPRLTLLLLGPNELGRLDRLTVRIRDDSQWRSRQVPIRATQEQFAKQVWGPYRVNKLLSPQGSNVDPIGRMISTDRMPVGESLTFFLWPTEPPPWWANRSSTKWNQKMGTVLRLQLEAQGKEGEIWTLPCEINTANGRTTLEVPEDHTA